jgi:hypothetical protein
MSQTVTCAHPGPLQVGTDLPVLTLTFKPKPAAAPSLLNTARVTHAYSDPNNDNNNQSTLTTPVRPLPASDFDGNGTSDISVFRNGAWLMMSSSTPITLGQTGDIPVPGDYDGDGVVQPAVFRPSTGTWYLCTANFEAPSCPMTTTTFGKSGDIPVPADYDGDGDADLAVFRKGNWQIQGMSNATLGQAGDIPVPAAYNGDGLADKAVFRPSAGKWWICHSEGCPEYPFGQNGDIPVPADYDGSGQVQMALFRPGNTTWYIYKGNSTVFGQTTDIPTLKRPTYPVYPY